MMNRIAQQPVTLNCKKGLMNSLGRLAGLFFFTAFVNSLNAQRVVISEPDKDDSRRMNFEIIGRMNGNYLIYKNIRADHFICLYDNEMKMIKKVKHEYLPDD